MIHSSSTHQRIFFTSSCISSPKTSLTKTLKTVTPVVCSLDSVSSSFVSLKHAGIRSESSPNQEQWKKSNDVSVVSDSFCTSRFCSCSRRRFFGALGTVMLPTLRSTASDLQSDSKAMLNRIHSPRPDWYEEFYAFALEKGMKPYEAEVAGYKAELFTNLRGKSKKVLELGIGTGANLKYYAGDAGVLVFGIDPNKTMEKYARAAAIDAGLPLSHFNFIQAVGEALPISDSSMDAVIGTLVLCSVTDVNLTLKEVKRVLKPGGLYIFIEHVAAQDGTALRFIQSFLDPLQHIVSDGCHLTRETGKYISEAGFSGVNVNAVLLPAASIIGPHVYDPLGRNVYEEGSKRERKIQKNLDEVVH